MKKTKSRIKKTDESMKKNVLKFRDYYDEELDDEEFELYRKERKNQGKRKHRKNSVKDEFPDNDS